MRCLPSSIPEVLIIVVLSDPLLSDRDRRNPTLAEIADALPGYVTDL